MTELILKPRSLSLEDLSGILPLGRVENDSLILERSQKGYKLKTPITVPLAKILEVGQRGLVEYIVFSLIRERPSLIPFVLENQSLIELGRYFLRYRSGSLQSFYAYTDTVSRYSAWLGHGPDQIIADCKDPQSLPNPSKIQKHTRLLEDYVAMLQDRKLSPGRVHTCAKHIKTLYKVNGITIALPYCLSRRVVNKDRAPKPEELQRLLDVADLREKVIVTILALGGFREGTLVRLRYCHVKEDLEKGIAPVHVHVESEITKGKYADYDTFLGAEAASSLKLYLDKRRQGSPDGKIPPEEIQDHSPLIRDAQSAKPKSIGEKQVRKLVHGLYHRAGLLMENRNGGYALRVHSLRKFFKTQLMALGVQSDYVDYMMGHTVSTYNDIQSKGIEFLRNLYASAGLSIRPRSHYSKIDMLKEMIRAWGLEPEKILTSEALAEPHRSYATPEDREKEEIRLLSLALKDHVKKELLASLQFPNPQL